MAGGTATSAVWAKDGQYLSLTTDADITIGNVVRITTTGTDTCAVGRAASNADTNLGVATGGDRFSRTATDDVIASGNKVTVCTRGIVRVYTDTSTIVRGSYLESAATGYVALAGTSGSTPATESMFHVIGIALDANSSAATTIRMKLLRG